MSEDADGITEEYLSLVFNQRFPEWVDQSPEEQFMQSVYAVLYPGPLPETEPEQNNVETAHTTNLL